MTPEVAFALRAELILAEQKRLLVYDDATGKPIVKGSTVLGNPTIGVGRNLSGRGLTNAEAEYLLANDMVELEADLAPALPWLSSLSPNRQCAVYSLYFNTALGNPARFKAKWPNFLGQMQRGEFEAAAANLETSEPWATQVGSRAERLAKFVRNG